MKVFKNTQFTKEAEKLSFVEFKKIFANQFSKEEMKEAYKIATNGNTKATVSKSEKSKSKEDK